MGAWDRIYKLGVKAEAGTPFGYGILAVKAELAYNGSADEHLDLTALACGHAFDRSAKAFQLAHGLIVDGEVGPHTAAALFQKRAQAVGTTYHVVHDYVCKTMHLESNCDPAAVGVADATDLGLLQIHMPAHPDVTVDEAFSPEYALEFAGRGLSSAYRKLGDWDATVASWNVGGGGAQAWLAAGKPASLYESWFTDQDGNPLDLGARATTYVRLVKAQTC